MSSKGWELFTFSDFVTINPSVKLDSSTEYSFVEMKNLNENYRYVSPSITRKLTGGARFQEKDTLFARITPCLENGKICQVTNLQNGVGFGSTEFLVFRGKAGISDSDFVYYLSRSAEVRKFAELNMLGTSGRQRVTWKAFNNLQLTLPPLPTQHSIVEKLSALDDKIELNRQTNATLEAIAQAIFKEWFVDFNYPGATGELVESELGPIPKGWRVGILSEVLSSIESGSRPKGGVGDLAEGIPSIGAENINGLGFYDFSKEKFVSEEFFAKLKSGIVKSEDVLLYKDGASLGRKTMFMDGFPHQICAINEHVFILRSNNLINQLFLYFWLDQSYMTENIKSLNSNSAQPGINQPAVRSLPILIPEKEISEKFEQIVKPLLSNLFNDCKESYSLSLLRDKLLPKLMSGEIQI
ncbi:MAG TPA: restriction endonuclease subunit S [Anaerolineaceae bacterium]|nr:restriction endonuclease subunit S [Anaerolineaceae bacterium]